MKNSKRIFKVFSYCTGFSFLNLVMQFIVTIPLMLVFILFREGPSLLSGNLEAFLNVDIEGITRDILLPALLLAGFLTFGIAWLSHVLFKKSFWERLSFTKVPVNYILISFIVGCAMQLPINYILYQVEKSGVASDHFQQYEQIVGPLMDGQNLFLMILTIGILIPMLEEIIFRGLVFHQLQKNMPVLPAVLIQGFLFGLVHLNLIQGLYALALGVLMALTMVWSRSLLLPIAIHIGMNLSAVFLSEFGSGIGITAEIILLTVSFILIPVGMGLLYWLIKRKKHFLSETKEYKVY